MNSLLTKEEQAKIANLCKTNPYKAMEFAEQIFKLLQMKTIREFAAISKLSERTIYNAVKDPEFASFEFAIFCNDKYIPAKLNKDLLK